VPSRSACASSYATPAPRGDREPGRRRRRWALAQRPRQAQGAARRGLARPGSKLGPLDAHRGIEDRQRRSQGEQRERRSAASGAAMIDERPGDARLCSEVLNGAPQVTGEKPSAPVLPQGRHVTTWQPGGTGRPMSATIRERSSTCSRTWYEKTRSKGSSANGAYRPSKSRRRKSGKARFACSRAFAEVSSPTFSARGRHWRGWGSKPLGRSRNPKSGQGRS
jgi:hypothetical protein